MPTYEKLLLLADLYKVSLDELIGRKTITRTDNGLSTSESNLIKSFRSLNHQGKEFILQSMDMAVMRYSAGDGCFSGIEKDIV